jgi:hypothetical protein
MTAPNSPRMHVQLGGILVVMGAVLAVLDQLLARCIGSGPCVPVPPLPIALFLGILATGVAWLFIALWEAHARTR